MFLGYAFSIDYGDRRGHAHMLEDQEATQRLTRPQSGSCLHCHASIMPLYRELGGGDAQAGLLKSYTYTYQALSQRLHQSGHVHPVSWVDCHEAATMKLRVTRPGFIQGIQALAASDAPVPSLPSVAQWRQGRPRRRQVKDAQRAALAQQLRAHGQRTVTRVASSPITAR